MDRLLATPYEELTVEALDRVLGEAYWTWGDWPSLAYYVPRLLEFYVERAHSETYADRIERGSLLDYVIEPMRPEERESVFRLVAVAFEARLHEREPPGETANSLAAFGLAEEISETLGFLVAIDGPVAPLLDRWRASPSPTVRGQLCLVLARILTHDNRRRSVFENVYLDALIPRPENQKALDRLLAEEPAMLYLLDHLDDIRLFGTDTETGVDAAFNWASR